MVISYLYFLLLLWSYPCPGFSSDLVGLILLIEGLLCRKEMSPCPHLCRKSFPPGAYLCCLLPHLLPAAWCSRWERSRSSHTPAVPGPGCHLGPTVPEDSSSLPKSSSKHTEAWTFHLICHSLSRALYFSSFLKVMTSL